MVEYVLNVARRRLPNSDWEYREERKGNFPRTHYCKIVIPDTLMSEEVKERAREIAKAFPAPEFECRLTAWENSGRTIDFLS